ncbi:hypothetical protein ALP97_04860, partial [Pseudomonas salomonii]
MFSNATRQPSRPSSRRSSPNSARTKTQRCNKEIPMPLSLLILALSAFAIGTTEFVIMGLLPDVAADLGVSIPGAGWLVTGYALGVAIGAPFMALATARLPRKAALV